AVSAEAARRYECASLSQSDPKLMKPQDACGSSDDIVGFGQLTGLIPTMPGQKTQLTRLAPVGVDAFLAIWSGGRRACLFLMRCAKILRGVCRLLKGSASQRAEKS